MKVKRPGPRGGERVLVAVPRSLWAIVSRMAMKYSDRETLEACVARAKVHAAISAKKKELG